MNNITWYIPNNNYKIVITIVQKLNQWKNVNVWNILLIIVRQQYIVQKSYLMDRIII